MPVKSRSPFRPLLLPALGLASALSIALALPSCSRQPASPAAGASDREAVEVTLAPVLIQPLQRSVSVTGSLFGQEETVISAKVPGRVVAIYRDLGDRALPGQVLAQIEQTDYLLARAQKEMSIQESLSKLGLKQLPAVDFDPSQVPTVEKARLQAENAKARFLRGKQLHDQQPPLISEQDYADLQTAWDVSRSNYDVELLTARSLLADARMKAADLDLAIQKLTETTICAPGEDPEPAGESLPPPATPAATQPATQPAVKYAVATRMVSVGEYVKEGAPLFKLVIENPLKYRATVAEKYVAQIRVGQRVELSIFAYPDRTFPATITRISPEVDPANRSFQIEAEVPNDAGLLKPGSFAKASILTHVDDAVTLVPKRAIVAFAGVQKVFAVKDGKALEIPVDPGQSTLTHVEIPAGLKGISAVVTSNGEKLATGIPVTVRAATAAAAAPTTAPSPAAAAN